ncbi:hypothetical protein CEXT_464431 [Caerostris extrusa]|uniref:Secreted protein n=1 Tax=Caerostris extrusa TaxID=172846 RepID=A0AAV4R4U5_CAEEX|nr:hypothetical protein CEXT_464431 [Caerostris extrusa]
MTLNAQNKPHMCTLTKVFAVLASVASQPRGLKEERCEKAPLRIPGASEVSATGGAEERAYKSGEKGWNRTIRRGLPTEAPVAHHATRGRCLSALQ